MGYNTNITICNDNLPDYERNPGRFMRLVRDGVVYGTGKEQWGVTVQPTDHADATQLIAAGGNFSTKLHTAYYVPSHHTEEGQVAILRSWAQALGFDLTERQKRG